MLAIARALVQRPVLLVTDEPSLGLAPRLVREVIMLAKRPRRVRGNRAASGAERQALVKIADRAYILEAGRIVRKGKPGELEKDPKIREAHLDI